MSKDLGSLIRRNTAWILGADIFARGYRFAISIVLARILVPADFGLLVTVQVFTGAAGFVAGGGMGEALVQTKQVGEHDLHVVFTMQLLICLVIYAIFFHIAPWFAVWFNEPRYVDFLRVSAMTFLLRPFGNIPRSTLRRAMRYKQITKAQVVGMFCGTTSSVVMALHGWGTWSLIIGGLLGTSVNTLILYYITRWRPGIRFRYEAARRLGGYGFRSSTNEIVQYLRGQTANFIVSRAMGPHMVGLYNKAASQTALPMQMMSHAAYQTVFRALASVQENLDKSRYIYFRTVALLAVYTLPIYVGLVFLAEPFIVFVYGQKWAPSAEPLQILALSGLCRVITNPSGAVTSAQNRIGDELRIQLESWVVLAVGVLIGLRWGLEGVAWGTLPASIYTSARMATLANRIIRGRMADFLLAMRPAMILNGALVLVFGITHLLLPSGLINRSPAIYLVVMLAAGGATYVLGFLYAPIPALATEAQRWKRKLRLQRD